MALIDEIVDITISRETTVILRDGFGTPFFLGDTKTTFPDKVKTYADLEEVAVDFATVDPEYIFATKVFSQDFTPDRLVIGQVTDSNTYLDAYIAIKLIISDFFGVCIDSTVEADLLAMAAQIETENRVFGVSSQQAGILTNTTGNILELLHNFGYARTFLIYGADADIQYPAGALMSRMLATPPGSATLAYKNLKGVVADNLTSTERANISLNNGIFYSPLGGTNVTVNGWMVNGEYIDVIYGLDWMEYTMQIAAARVFIDNEKVPYTLNGVGLFENAITGVLQQAEANGIINGDFVVAAVSPDLIPSSVKGTRIYSGLSFTATLQGAIHEISVTGKVTF